MFNVARAALLNSGVPESKLPKTHNGLIAAFGEEAVKARKLDPNLGRALSKTESLRLMADYTGHQIDQPTAEGAVAWAELFIRTVEREFGLEGLAAQPDLNPDASKTVSEKNQASSVPASFRGAFRNTPATVPRRDSKKRGAEVATRLLRQESQRA
jgi:uncharacterized protein (UPF0332 family)